VKHFLVVYDRRQGHIVRHRGYRAPSSALAARFDAEREFKGQSDIEVVVLGAESWDDLPRTHARYFKGVQELAEAALGRVDAES
jgi:hypothetical protein